MEIFPAVFPWLPVGNPAGEETVFSIPMKREINTGITEVEEKTVEGNVWQVTNSRLNNGCIMIVKYARCGTV